jgi:hypothetical protein
MTSGVQRSGKTSLALAVGLGPPVDHRPDLLVARPMHQAGEVPGPRAP